MTTPERSAADSATVMKPDHPATEDLWSGHSRLLAFWELAIAVVLAFCAVITVLTTLGIVLVLSVQTVEFFVKSKVGILDFLLGTELKPDATPPKFGILPLIWGTFVIAFGSSCIALPIGLLSAIYLSEYAPRGLRGVLKPALELLAGIPTIVYGYLALAAGDAGAQGDLRAAGHPGRDSSTRCRACIVVGVMIIPLVSSLSEDVLSAVPRGLREAAYGLGATKFEVSTRIVLPAGLSGVVASFILAISRAVGETMAVVLAAGMRPQITLNPLDSVETMTTYIVQVIGGEASYGSAEVPLALRRRAVALRRSRWS